MNLTEHVKLAARYGRQRVAPDVDPDAHALRRAGQVGTIISVVVLSVVALVGVLVLAQIDSALPAIDNTQLNSTSSSITSGFANAMELFPVVVLTLVASLVIGIVQRIRT